MDSTLQRLQQWYLSQCNGDWEHGSGVKIDTLDNPGWIIKIDLAGTSLEGKAFEAVTEGLAAPASGLAHPDAPIWHSISVKNNTFEAAGDPSKLGFMLNAFLNWAYRPGR